VKRLERTEPGGMELTCASLGDGAEACVDLLHLNDGVRLFTDVMSLWLCLGGDVGVVLYNGHKHQLRMFLSRCAVL